MGKRGKPPKHKKPRLQPRYETPKAVHIKKGNRPMISVPVAPAMPAICMFV